MSKGDGAVRALVTVGMRGDGDEPMTEGTATQLLESIVADQRDIIRDVTGKPAEQTAAGLGALQGSAGLLRPRHESAGRRHPAVRRRQLGPDPPPARPATLNRKGGYGVYYHFDYVGGPRNYKWLNTNQIEKTWQQMDLAYQRGARALWIVNVGDIKPMELPLSFFMAQAWDPEAMTLDADD